MYLMSVFRIRVWVILSIQSCLWQHRVFTVCRCCYWSVGGVNRANVMNLSIEFKDRRRLAFSVGDLHLFPDRWRALDGSSGTRHPFSTATGLSRWCCSSIGNSETLHGNGAWSLCFTSQTSNVSPVFSFEAVVGERVMIVDCPLHWRDICSFI